jgi:hypothetical protein
VRSHLSFKSKRELLLQIAPRYREASAALKTVILDEFVAATGYARKYAIRLLSHPVAPKLTIERPRSPHYGPEVQQALHLAWTAANHICAKRLIPLLPTLVESLERHGHLHLSEQCRMQLLSISPATADRILRRTASKSGMGSRRPDRERCSNSRSQCAPSRIGTRPHQAFWKPTWWPIVAPRQMVLTSTRFPLTDIVTGWTECLPLLGRGESAVVAALKRAKPLLPFPILGIDTDNGGEFINLELLAFCEQAQITFTRGRPRKSNDQCHVEVRRFGAC